MKEHTEEQRSFPIGKGSATVGTNNAIYTSKYTLWNFLFIVSAYNILLLLKFYLLYLCSVLLSTDMNRRDFFFFFNICLSLFSLRLFESSSVETETFTFS
jgi:hypothetical protein